MREQLCQDRTVRLLVSAVELHPEAKSVETFCLMFHNDLDACVVSLATHLSGFGEYVRHDDIAV